MRIVYDHQLFSLQDAGGATRYHYELARSLRSRDGVRVELLLGLNASVLPFAELSGDAVKVIGWKTGMKAGAARYALNEILSFAALLRGEFDIYHPTLYRILPLVRHRRLVATHHDCAYERFPHLFPKASAIVRLKRKLFSQADAILCVSESSRQDLLHFYDIDEAKTHVIHHGFSPLAGSQDLGLTASAPGAPYLLFIGNRLSYKNFLLLLEAFAASGLPRDYRLTAVGGGPFSAEEESAINRLGLSGRVSLLPRAGDRVLAGLYRNSSLLVYPSLYEGFGFPPLEAMSLGCPVLVNRTSSLPEICGSAAFYFQLAEVDELSRALVATLADPESLNEKRKLGFEQVKRYDWARAAEQTLSVYRQCLSE